MVEIQSVEIDREQFKELVTKNTGILVLKFGAEWCGPCKTIWPLLEKHAERMPANVTILDIDVDDSFDLYAWMKSKKQVNGIPVLQAYYPGSSGLGANYSVTGADADKVEMFFDEVERAALTL